MSNSFSAHHGSLISTVFAFYLWNRGFELIDAGTGSLFFFAQPLVGSLLGFFLLHEPLSPGFFTGGALILTGVALAARE